MSKNQEVELGEKFLPKFGADGLIPCVTVDAETGQVLMVAYMNREALEKSLITGRGTYYSRSRNKLWVKGESSGHVQHVKDMLVDCDQDCLVMKVSAEGGQCHAGYRSCFYRRVKPHSAAKDGSLPDLKFIEKKIFDPNKVY